MTRINSDRTRARQTGAAAGPADSEVSALARGLALLRAVADAERPPSNKDLADATGIPKATVSRLAATLLAGGFLRQSAQSERFGLGTALLDLSNAYLRHFDLRSQAREALAGLAEFAGAAVHLGVRDGLDILVIDTMRARSALILARIDVGARMSVATSAAGRALLCALPKAERDALHGEIRRSSPRAWPAIAKRLEASCQEHTRLGFCSSFGEWHPHINALGFTLRGPRGELHAVSCGGPAYLLSKQVLLERVAPVMLSTRDAIEREIGAVSSG